MVRRPGCNPLDPLRAGIEKWRFRCYSDRNVGEVILGFIEDSQIADDRHRILIVGNVDIGGHLASNFDRFDLQVGSVHR